MSDTDDTVITLHDGTVISTRTGRPVRAAPQRPPPGYVEVPTNSEAVRAVTRIRKRLADLPDIPSRMNVIGAIAAYHMFGLDTHEIAYAIGATERQVGNIMMTAAFTDLIGVMQQNIVATEQDNVRALIATHAKSALDTIVGAMDSENEQVAVVAAKDILDRAGHRPNDVIEHLHRVEGGLTIEYVRKGNQDDNMPVIDMQVEDQ